MASTVLPNGIIIPEKYSRDWYADLYHNWQELDNLLGGGGANDGTLTIQKNGTTVGTFSANQATDETINIEVPTKTSDLNNDSGFITGVSWNDVSNKPSFATVATSGSYNDLSNKPTIPTVNNATLTIQQNGTTVDTFTANSSSDKTVNIQCVDLTNNQTVGGIKTFSNAPVVNSISLDGKTIDTDANGNMTYDSHIVDTIEEQGKGYIRYTNGLQVCFERYVANANSDTPITLPKPFINTNYISALTNYSGAGPVCAISSYNNKTITGFTIVNIYGGNVYVDVMSIGRWK